MTPVDQSEQDYRKAAADGGSTFTNTGTDTTTDISPNMHQKAHRSVGVKPVPSTRPVMLPLWIMGALFALAIGLNAPEKPRFEPLTGKQNGLVLNLRDSAAQPLNPAFVPASDALRARVQASLSRLQQSWEKAGITVTVAPDAQTASASEFAGQLRDWLGQYELVADAGDAGMDGNVGVDVAGSDATSMQSLEPAVARASMIIRCQQADGSRARQLALAVAPMLRGDISIVYSARAVPGQFDLQIQSEPKFNNAGVAHFPTAA
ncbi:MAG: hypothetical protein AAGI24_00835 [Pseudomonadota bacterium]